MVEKHDDWDIKMMSPPIRWHINISGNIYRIFSNYLRGKKCKVYHDGRPIKIPDGIKEKYKDIYEEQFKKPFPQKYLLPDLMVICDPLIDKERWVDGAPTLLIEILSDSTADIDKTINKDIYKDIGVKEYWIVYTDKDLITVFDFISGKEIDVDEEDNSQFSPINFTDLIIDFNEIFEE
jgi:Uma2 family endonuclease